MYRLLESQIEDVMSLRDEIHARVSRLKAERSGIGRLWERHVDGLGRLLAEIDASLATLERESQQMRRSWASQVEAIDQLRGRIEAAGTRLVEKVEQQQPSEDQRVSLRGRILPSPGRSTVTIEICATAGFHWRPTGTVMVGGQHVTVVEQGTTRPGPIVVGSLVRLELSATSAQISRSNELEIPSEDTVLVVALDVAG